MSQNRNIIKCLRERVATIDRAVSRHVDDERNGRRLSFGVPEIDYVLGGGLLLEDMHEIRCSNARDIGAATGFLMGLLAQIRSSDPIFWVAEGQGVFEAGLLFPDGMSWYGLDAARFIHVRPMHLQDALWAVGETARSAGLAAIVLHVKGNQQRFDLSASRKLMLRAQTSGTPLFMLRQAGDEEASSVATRWHVSPLQSLPSEIYTKGVGHMRLHLTLEKNRNGQTGQWPVAWNPEQRSFEHAATHVSSTHPELPLHPPVYRPYRTPAMGKIMALETSGRKAS